MRGFIFRLSCAALAFVGLSGFENKPKLPPDYSPNYSYMEVITPDGREKRVLVPESCLSEEEEPPLGQMGKPWLPPGCANAFNLMRMVERKKDLMKGRRLGPAPATPAARATVNYLNGTTTSAGGNGAPPVNSSPASTTKE